MTKIEFLEKLRTALANDLTGAVIQENVDYYAGYIRSETEAGRNEEEVIEELGDPWVIAQTIIDTSVPAGANAPYEAEGQAYGQAYGQETTGASGKRPAGAGFLKGLLVLLGVIGVLFIIITVVGGIVSLVAPVLIPVLVVIFIVRTVRGGR